MSTQAERDRPAPEDEVEVTEEMVAAGAAVIADSCQQPIDPVTKGIARDVFRTMVAVRPSSP